MRSRWAIFWFALAALCGAMLFHTSQQATDGRARLAVLADATAKEEETVRVLAAEWSYLNKPERLEKLARANFDLAPMKGGQFVTPSALDGFADIETAAGDPVPAPKKIANKVVPKKSAPKKVVAPVSKAAPEPVKPAPLRSVQGRSFGDVMQALGVD